MALNGASVGRNAGRVGSPNRDGIKTARNDRHRKPQRSASCRLPAMSWAGSLKSAETVNFKYSAVGDGHRRRRSGIIPADAHAGRVNRIGESGVRQQRPGRMASPIAGGQYERHLLTVGDRVRAVLGGEQRFATSLRVGHRTSTTATPSCPGSAACWTGGGSPTTANWFWISNGAWPNGCACGIVSLWPAAGRSGDRYPCSRPPGRSPTAVLHVRRNSARAAMARRYTGVLRHSPGHAHP